MWSGRASGSGLVGPVPATRVMDWEVWCRARQREVSIHSLRATYAAVLRRRRSGRSARRGKARSTCRWKRGQDRWRLNEQPPDHFWRELDALPQKCVIANLPDINKLLASAFNQAHCDSNPIYDPEVLKRYD